MCDSPSIIRVIKSRRMRWAGHGACTGDMRNAYKVFTRKYEQKKPLRRPRHIWENNNRMDGNRVERCGLGSSHSG